MIKMVLLCAMLVALVVSATGRTTQNSYLKSSPGIQISFYPSLGFSNQTGSCFGESELNSLIGFLSKASTLYRSDLKENLKYIQQNMDASFGTSNERYNVFIQNNPSSISSYLVYPSGQGGCNYASLTFGINLVNPEWSYLVVKNYYSYVPEFKYVGQNGIGNGVSAETKTKIQKIIFDEEKRFYDCLCNKLPEIASNIKNYDGQDWSIVCQRINQNYAYFAPKNDQWISTSPYECGYIIYVQ